MPLKHRSVQDFVKRRLSAAKANKGWSWPDLSRLLNEFQAEQSGSTLTTKHSRGAFRVQDYVLMMKALGVRQIDLSELDIDGLDAAIAKVEKMRVADK